MEVSLSVIRYDEDDDASIEALSVNLFYYI